MWTVIYVIVAVIVVAAGVWLVMKAMKKKDSGQGPATPPSPQGPMQQPPQTQ